MQIINIITTENNIVSDIKSFPIVVEETESEVIEQVEKEFTDIVNNFSKPNVLNYVELNECLDNGCFEYKGINISIVWSSSNNE